MTLIEELTKNRRLDPWLRAKVAGLDPATDPDKPLFSALLMVSGEQPLSVPGATFSSRMGNIASVREISLNGLKNLLDEPRVVTIEGSRPMYPDQARKSGGPKP